MKKRQTLLALLMTLLLLTGLLTGCGASAGGVTEEMGYMTNTQTAPMEAPMAMMDMAMKEEAVEQEFSTYTTNDDTAGSGMEVEQVQTYAEKIIYSGHVYMETTEFDNAIAALDKAVQDFGGFVQDSNVNGHTRNYDDGTTKVVDRWSCYTIRIPAEKFDAFMTLAGELGNVTSSSRNAENVTSQYTDHEARLASLRTQEERLLVMLEESGDLESLIQLEARLSEVRYEIESIERNLRDLDQRLAYSTVTLELQEVSVYTPTANAQRSFGEKVADAFRDTWKSFGRGWQNFAVGLVYALPTLLLLAAFAVIGFICGRKIIRKRRQRKEKNDMTEA